MTTASPTSTSPTTTPSQGSTFPSRCKLKLIVAYSLPTYSIGLNGSIPWHYPADLAHFKSLTLDHTVIMGHRTWKSLPIKPLPGRTNVILTRSTDSCLYQGAWTCYTWGEVFHLLSVLKDPTPFIIGGASLYTQSLQQRLVEEVIATEIQHHHPGDTFFPHHLTAHWPRTILQSTPDFTIVSYKEPTL